MKILYYSFLLLLPLFFACEDEPISKADPSKVIQVNSELYNLIEKACGKDFENEITCIDFNYAFTLVIYDEDMEIFGYQIIRSDNEFSDFLGTLEEGKSISLSYPITSILVNGENYTINNNEELKEAIDKCVAADTITTCNNILTQACLWKVTHLDGPNSQYDGAYFEVSNSGTTGFFYNGDSFHGTWITYSIENKLHLNIYLQGDESIITDWNYDWKIVGFDDSWMEIDNGIDRFKLVKECNKPCKKFLFEECETVPGSGKAVFDLESYFECFFPLTYISDPSTVSWSYYKTEEDMEAGTNPIVDLMYENTINPQVIYVRFDNINTGEYITDVPIILLAISCP